AVRLLPPRGRGQDTHDVERFDGRTVGGLARRSHAPTLAVPAAGVALPVGATGRGEIGRAHRYEGRAHCAQIIGSPQYARPFRGAGAGDPCRRGWAGAPLRGGRAGRAPRRPPPAARRIRASARTPTPAASW